MAIDYRLNIKVELLHESIRDREVVMRGRDHKESVEALMEALRFYHNYIKTHQGLDGRRPAETSGVKIKGENK